MHKIIFLETYVIQTPVLCMLLDIRKLNVKHVHVHILLISLIMRLPCVFKTQVFHIMHIFLSKCENVFCNSVT